mgnify:CR=1 FL=1
MAALLAVAMMLQMLPMLAFAEDALGTGKVRNKRTGTIYTSLKEAVQQAWSGDTIELGEGNYTLYGIKSDETTRGKNLTFVGQGIGITAWNIGAEVPNPEYFGTEYNGDYSFDGAGKITFKNMTLRSGNVDYLGFIRADQTVVDNCVINGKTFYWGYQSAEFINTTFNAPSGDYALWTYSSPTMEFDNCTFNTKGAKRKVINVYTDYSAGKHDITVYFNNCTVNSRFSPDVGDFDKTALNINDSNMSPFKYIIYIHNPQTITAARDKTTCSQMFGFGGKEATNNTGHTDVYLDGDLVWTNGKIKKHSYTDGEKEDAYEITGRSDWTPSVERVDECEVTKTCKYCGWTKKELEHASVYRLQYNLNEGIGDATANYNDAFYHENESVKLAAAPTREGYQFAGWLSQKGKLYKAESELEQLTGDEVFTAQWKKDEPVVNHTLTVTGGTFAVKNGDIRHFFLVGGCDGARPGRNYYTEFVKQTPKDTVILTLACGKYRFNDLDLGEIGGLPRIMDMGQCNDAYSAIQVAIALAKAFDCDVNELPLSMILSWYEQKAVCILLTLLHLGIKNIYLGPTLPAFLSKNVLQYLIDEYHISKVSTPEEDLKQILS